MCTNKEKLEKLTTKPRYRISKIKPKEKPTLPDLFHGTIGGVVDALFKKKVKGLTLRKIMLKTIENKFFEQCLDLHFKGTKREIIIIN